MLAQDVSIPKPIFNSAPLEIEASRSPDKYLSWTIKKMGIDSLHQIGITGKGVKICICDTGYPIHDLLPEEIFADSVNFSFDNTALDLNGHATGVTHVVFDAAPGAIFYESKTLDIHGSGSSVALGKAIDWCVSKGVDIINLSLGGSMPSSYTREATKRAVDKGILVIAAAGNDGIGEPLNYPAAYEWVKAIGSINANYTVSYFSNSGPGDYVTFGHMIQTAYAGNKIILVSGTSFSTPLITAIEALRIEANKKGINIDEILTIDIDPQGFDEQSFKGAPDIFKTFQLIHAPKDSTITEQDSTVIDTPFTPIDTIIQDSTITDVPTNEPPGNKNNFGIYLVIGFFVVGGILFAVLYQQDKEKAKAFAQTYLEKGEKYFTNRRVLNAIQKLKILINKK